MRRAVWFASLFGLLSVAGSGQAAILFTYTFAGPNDNNPEPFAPSAVSVPGLSNLPTITASTPTGNLVTTTVVRQSSLGLGVSSGLEPLPIVGSPAQRTRVDGFGTVLNLLAQETLALTFTNTNNFLTDERLRSVTLTGANDTGPAPDFELFLNGTSLGTFDFPSTSGGTLSLVSPGAPTGIAIQSGDVLSLTPLFSATNANRFAVSGLEVSAVPEPATCAVFGALAAGAWAFRRRGVRGVTA